MSPYILRSQVDYAERRAALIVKRLVVDKGEAPWQKGGGAGMRGRRREPRLRESFYSYDGSDDSSSGDSCIGGRSSSLRAPDAGLWDNEAAAAAKELFTRSSAAVKSGRADANTQRRLRVLKGSDDFRDLRNAEVHQSSHARDRKSNETFSSSNSTQVASRRITQPPQVQHYQQPEQARRRLVSFCPPTVPLCAARKRAKKEAILKDAKEALANKAKAQAAAAERSEANAIRRAELEERERAAAIERQWEKERAHKAAESERLGAFKEYMRSHKGEMVWFSTFKIIEALAYCNQMNEENDILFRIIKSSNLGIELLPLIYSRYMFLGPCNVATPTGCGPCIQATRRSTR